MNKRLPKFNNTEKKKDVQNTAQYILKKVIQNTTQNMVHVAPVCLPWYVKGVAFTSEPGIHIHDTRDAHDGCVVLSWVVDKDGAMTMYDVQAHVP